MHGETIKKNLIILT